MESIEEMVSINILVTSNNSSGESDGPDEENSSNFFFDDQVFDLIKEEGENKEIIISDIHVEDNSSMNMIRKKLK